MRDRAFRFPVETHGPGRSHPHVAVKDVLPPHQLGEPNPSRVFYARNPDLRPNPHDGHIYNGGGRPIDRERPCHTILASAGGNKTHFFDDLGLVPEYHRELLEGHPPRTGACPAPDGSRSRNRPFSRPSPRTWCSTAPEVPSTIKSATRSRPGWGRCWRRPSSGSSTPIETTLAPRNLGRRSTWGWRNGDAARYRSLTHLGVGSGRARLPPSRRDGRLGGSLALPGTNRRRGTSIRGRTRGGR